MSRELNGVGWAASYLKLPASPVGLMLVVQTICTGLSVWPRLLCSMEAGFQEQVSWRTRQKLHLSSWPSLRSHRVSLPLHHRSPGPPSQSRGKKLKTHLLMGRVSTSHRNQCLWDGRPHYSRHGKSNLPITNRFLDKGMRLRAASGARLEVHGRVKSNGKRPFRLTIYRRFLT